MYSSNGRRVPQIQLTHSEQSHYDAIVANVLQTAIKEYAGFQGFIDTDDWAYVRRRKQMSVYRSLQPCDDPRATVMVGTGLIPGTLEDVMDGLYCDTTSELRGVKTFIKYKFLDGAVLNVSERRTPQAPFRFAGIKWTAATAAWGVAKNRDLLTYDRMGTITDRQGNELAYHVLTSIDRPEWPANNIKGIQRTEITTCYLYKRHKHRVVQCFMWGKIYDINNSGPIVQRIAEYVAASTWLNVVRSVESAEAKKLSKLMLRAGERQWTVSNACHVCYKNTSRFGSSHIQCAGCSQMTCKACSMDKKIFQIDKKTNKPMEDRFCKLCLNKLVAKKAKAPQRERRDRMDSAPVDTGIPTQRDRWDSAPVSLGIAAMDISRAEQIPTRKAESRSMWSQSTSTSSSFDDSELLRSSNERPSTPESRSKAKQPATKTKTESKQDFASSIYFSTASFSSIASSSSVSSASSVLSSSTASSMSSSSGRDSQPEPSRSTKPKHVDDDLEMRRTTGLGSFDLEMDLLGAISDMQRQTSSSENSTSQTHHDLSRRRVRERFITDLYVSPPPSPTKVGFFA
ncbi:hypothetical protein FI667_g7283, partial [Globisporangium splendens]